MRLARGGGEACIDWDAEAGTGGGIHSEHPPPSPEEEVWRGGGGPLSGRQDPFHLRLRKGGWERDLDLCKLGERWGMGSSGTLEKYGVARQGGWASCPVGEEGSSSASFQDP